MLPGELIVCKEVWEPHFIIWIDENSDVFICRSSIKAWYEKVHKIKCPGWYSQYRCSISLPKEEVVKKGQQTNKNFHMSHNSYSICFISVDDIAQHTEWALINKIYTEIGNYRRKKEKEEEEEIMRIRDKMSISHITLST